MAKKRRRRDLNSRLLASEPRHLHLPVKSTLFKDRALRTQMSEVRWWGQQPIKLVLLQMSSGGLNPKWRCLVLPRLALEVNPPTK